MPRGTSRGPAQDRPLGVARRPRAAVARRRCHASTQTRSVRAADRPLPARGRSAPPTQPSRPSGERHQARRPAASCGPLRVRALTGATPPVSAPSLAPRRQPPPRNLHAPAPVPRNARARQLHPHRASPPPGHGATHGGPGRSPNRLPPPARDEHRAARQARRLRTSPTAQAGDGRSLRRPAPASLPAPLRARSSPESRAASLRATEVPGPRAAPPPPGAATAARRPGAAPAAA